MTREEFRKKIIKSNLLDICFYNLLFAAMVLGGIFFLYEVTAHQPKWNIHATRATGYLSFAFLFYFGLRGLWLMPNRYKILTIISTVAGDRKNEAILEVGHQLGDPYCAKDQDLFKFTYQRRWWTARYRVYASYDEANLFVSVQGVTGGAYGPGIMDLGQTEKLRKRILTILTDSLP